ncbi:MAG: hypothetical protein WCG27_09835 [Pseudomonadota bacterium]
MINVGKMLILIVALGLFACGRNKQKTEGEKVQTYSDQEMQKDTAQLAQEVRTASLLVVSADPNKTEEMLNQTEKLAKSAKEYAKKYEKYKKTGDSGHIQSMNEDGKKIINNISVILPSLVDGYRKGHLSDQDFRQAAMKNLKLEKVATPTALLNTVQYDEEMVTKISWDKPYKNRPSTSLANSKDASLGDLAEEILQMDLRQLGANSTISDKVKEDFPKDLKAWAYELRTALPDQGVFKINYEQKMEATAKQKLQYNKNKVLVFDAYSAARMQCFSGTLLNTVMLLNAYQNTYAFNKAHHVIIFLDGHIMPGQMKQNDQKEWLLYGVETTVEGQAAVEFGKASELSIPIRVINMRDFALMMAQRENFKNINEIAKHMLNKATHFYGINPEAENKVGQQFAATDNLENAVFTFGGTAYNSTPWSFGIPKVKDGINY